jgi:hypothetical protein
VGLSPTVAFPCDGPWALVKGKSGARVQIDVAYHHGRKHLPILVETSTT